MKLFVCRIDQCGRRWETVCKLSPVREMACKCYKLAATVRKPKWSFMVRNIYNLLHMFRSVDESASSRTVKGRFANFCLVHKLFARFETVKSTVPSVRGQNGNGPIFLRQGRDGRIGQLGTPRWRPRSSPAVPGRYQLIMKFRSSKPS
jgi:hypothetical protein